MASLDAEEQAFQAEVKDVKQWWTDSRWRYTRRPFTAEQIVAKRGNLQIQYPSNAMSKKLWKILEERFQVREIDHVTLPSPYLHSSRTKILVLPMAV